MRLFLRKWQIAYRLKPQGSIFNDLRTTFVAVPNTHNLVAADPFLFVENGITYLFAELLDKRDGIGKLGYSVFNGTRFSEWKVIISEAYHLSYPNIFKYNDEIYIIPEANESKSLYAYRAKSFPDAWEKISPPIMEGRQLVDTTFLDYYGEHLMFTYDIIPDNNKKLYIYKIQENGKTELYVDDYISDDDATARPGGNFFSYNDDIIRVSQNCDGDYGIGVVFSKIKECSQNGYSEEKIMEISPANVKINKKFVSGLHTYNANEQMEVIDFHVIDFDPIVQVRRILEKLGLRK